MGEQELRDYIKAWTFTFGSCVNVGKNAAYDAHVVALDDDTVAIRILHDRIVAYNWCVCTYGGAVSLLKWADAGGNWKKDEVRQ